MTTMRTGLQAVLWLVVSCAGCGSGSSTQQASASVPADQVSTNPPPIVDPGSPQSPLCHRRRSRYWLRDRVR